MQIALYAIGFGILGYLFGSVPSAVIITRLVKGVDVRDFGSHHATTTNTYREAGILPAAVVWLLDVVKGFLPTWLAMRYAPVDWIAALTAGLAVVGHCWPVFAGFRGGMGLATSHGSMTAAFLFALPIGYALVGLLTLLIRHSARASMVAGLLFAPLFWLMGLRGVILWIAAAVGLVIIIRFTSDWNRQYRELWLDREKKPTEQ